MKMGGYFDTNQADLPQLQIVEF